MPSNKHTHKYRTTTTKEHLLSEYPATIKRAVIKRRAFVIQAEVKIKPVQPGPSFRVA